MLEQVIGNSENQVYTAIIGAVLVMLVISLKNFLEKM
jgi:hypothetical protein